LLSVGLGEARLHAQAVTVWGADSDGLGESVDFGPAPFFMGAYAVDNHDGTVTSHNLFVSNWASAGEPPCYEILGQEYETIPLADFYANYASHYVLYTSWDAAVSAAIAYDQSLPPRTPVAIDPNDWPWDFSWIW
jgi:hypothetical protein